MRFRLIALLLALSGVFGARASLAATQTPTPSITLIWTAPGDDSLTGTATRYDLRMSPSAITEANFAAAYQITFAPSPTRAGTQQQLSILNLSPGTRYYFAIKSRDEAGNWSKVSNLASSVASLLAENSNRVPLQMSQAFPNPARSGATFGIGLPEHGRIRIEIFDVTGRRVRLLADHEAAPGWSSESWDLRGDDGSPVCGGVYYALGRIGGSSFSRRVTVLR